MLETTHGANVARDHLTVRSCGMTDRGRVRESNEDQFLVAELTKNMRVSQSSLPGPQLQTGDERAHLFLVADGMGGHEAGERASALAAQAIEQFTVNRLKWFHADAADATRTLTDFQSAMRQADSRVVDEAEGHPELAGMGTTLTMAYHLQATVCVVHVGDSRAYLFRDGALHQLTNDHTVTAELVKSGAITPEEARTHRYRNVITNVVGGPVRGVNVEALACDVHLGDRLLLCSDGLTEMLTNDRIAATLRAEAEPEAACRSLVEQANNAGGRDNITVIVVRFDAPVVPESALPEPSETTITGAANQTTRAVAGI